MRWYAAWLRRVVAMGFVSGSGGALTWGAGAGAGWGQAQQQHRMTPQHMESMRMRVTAVVEDIGQVEHAHTWFVHGVSCPSRLLEWWELQSRGADDGHSEPRT
jgi:hypothetical protein